MQRPIHSRRANRKSRKWPSATLALAIVLVAFGSLVLGSTIFATAKNAQLAAALQPSSCTGAKNAGCPKEDAKNTYKCPVSQGKSKDKVPKNCVLNKVCSEKGGASGKTIMGTCACPEICKANADEATDKNDPGKDKGKGAMPTLPGQESGQPPQMQGMPKAEQVEQLPQQTPIAPNSAATPPPAENKSWAGNAWDTIQRFAGIEPASVDPQAVENIELGNVSDDLNSRPPIAEGRTFDAGEQANYDDTTGMYQSSEPTPKTSDNIPDPPPAYDNSNSTFASSEQRPFYFENLSPDAREIHVYTDADGKIRDITWSDLPDVFRRNIGSLLYNHPFTQGVIIRPWSWLTSFF